MFGAQHIYITLSGPVLSFFWYEQVALTCSLINSFFYGFRTHSEIPVADARFSCALTIGVINLCCCNADGLTSRECTNANYQITRLYVLTRLALHAYHQSNRAVKHFNIPADKCSCIMCGQARGGYYNTTCKEQCSAL